MSVARVCTQTPGQSLLSAVLVIVSSRPVTKTHIYRTSNNPLCAERRFPFVNIDVVKVTNKYFNANKLTIIPYNVMN